MSDAGYGHAGLPPVPSALLTRPRRHSVLFTVLLSVAMLVGAGVMALVLLASNAPGALVVGVLLAALPVGPVVAAFLWLDRYEPEPLVLLGLAFGWGALVATAAALVFQALNQVVLGTPESAAAAVVAPVTEEAAKGVFVLLLVWMRRNAIDGVLDGIVYAGLVGVGFAFTENILYLAAAYMGGGELGPGGLAGATGVFVVRGIFSPFAHPLFTAATGIGVGIAVVARSGMLRVVAPATGYVVAVAAHGLWNGSALLADGRLFLLTYVFLMVPAFLLVAGLAIWARRREGQMLTRSLTDAAERGLIPPADVPWLVRLPGRRAARKYAQAHGGAVGERVMREYQQQAVELGFLHDRYVRGTPPPDFARRGALMVERLRALRPWVLMPPSRPAYPLGAGPGAWR